MGASDVGVGGSGWTDLGHRGSGVGCRRGWARGGSWVGLAGPWPSWAEREFFLFFCFCFFIYFFSVIFCSSYCFSFVKYKNDP